MTRRKAFPTPLDDGNRAAYPWILWWRTVEALQGNVLALHAVLSEGPLHA